MENSTKVAIAGVLLAGAGGLYLIFSDSAAPPPPPPPVKTVPAWKENMSIVFQLRTSKWQNRGTIYSATGLSYFDVDARLRYHCRTSQNQSCFGLGDKFQTHGRPTCIGVGVDFLKNPYYHKIKPGESPVSYVAVRASNLEAAQEALDRECEGMPGSCMFGRKVQCNF